jgi:DNA polymerase-3 subunit delta'
MPETVLIERGWPLGEKAQAEIDDKKRKASREIRVEAMRETIEFSQRTSARGRAKVVLVYPAERMNHVTANALLKTLEEPPGDVKFVLATEASHLLLPTIRSRCMGHAMAWPETAAALDWLAAQGFPPADARALLRIAGGRPDDALLLGRSGPPAESWPRLPRALARGDVGALSGFTPAQAITVLQKLCHDLLSQGCGAPPRFFDAADLPETSARMSISRLSGWAQSLARAARTAEHPFNPGLALEDLATQAHHIFHLP